MDVFMHLLGVCHDTQSHLDLLDLLFMGFGGLSAYVVMGRYALCRLRGKCRS